MTNFPNDNIYPWQTIVYIEARFGSSWFSGSGVIVGRNDILTASHVIYDAPYGLADDVLVYPSYNINENGPLFEGVNFEYYDDFDPDADDRIFAGDDNLATLAGAELDVALITLDYPVGDDFGWMGIDYAFNEGIMNISGYPGTSNGYLYSASGYVFEDDIDYFLHLENFIINAGNSGGPIWFDVGNGPRVAGVVSTSLAGADLSAHEWLSDSIAQNDGFIIEPRIDLVALVFATASNTDQFEGLSAAYEILLGGVPSVDGFTFLINANNDSNFGSFSTVQFNEENIYINVMNALFQGNPTARAAFTAIAPGASLQTKLSNVYDYVVHWSQQSAEGRAYFVAQSDFYALRAAELGIAGSDGAALVGLAALVKIAVGGDLIGIGDGINDLRSALNTGTDRIPQSGSLTPRELADGIGYDGDDGGLARAANAGTDAFSYVASTDDALPSTIGEIELVGADQRHLHDWTELVSAT